MGEDIEKYRNKITYLSFIMAVLVVIRHSNGIEVYNLSPLGGGSLLYRIERFAEEISDLCVPTFFALSGYLFFQNYSPEKLREKWKSRIISIALPYLVWNVIAYIYYEMLAHIPMISAHLNSSIEPFALTWLIKNALCGLHNVTWFLRNLMVYIILFPLIYKVICSKRIALAFSCMLLAAGMAIGDSYSYSYIYNASFYMLGVYFGIHHRESVQKRYERPVAAAAFIYLILTVCGNAWLDILTFSLRLPLRMTQIIAVWIIADALAVQKKPAWWIKISFFIYCTHSMVLESVEKVFLIVLGNNILGAAIDFFLAPVITIIVITVLAYFIKKVPIVWRILVGNR